MEYGVKNRAPNRGAVFTSAALNETHLGLLKPQRPRYPREHASTFHAVSSVGAGPAIDTSDQRGLAREYVPLPRPFPNALPNQRSVGWCIWHCSPATLAHCGVSLITSTTKRGYSETRRKHSSMDASPRIAAHWDPEGCNRRQSTWIPHIWSPSA